MYRWVDHTAELELAIDADTEADVFAEGLRALAELLAAPAGTEIEQREIALAAADRPTLLAEWLGELVFLAETDEFLAERLARLDLDDGRLLAIAEGRRGRPTYLVKAVTYHRLEFGRVDGRWRARVVLDV